MGPGEARGLKSATLWGLREPGQPGGARGTSRGEDGLMGVVLGFTQNGEHRPPGHWCGGGVLLSPGFLCLKSYLFRGSLALSPDFLITEESTLPPEPP